MPRNSNKTTAVRSLNRYRNLYDFLQPVEPYLKLYSNFLRQYSENVNLRNI